MNRIRLISFDGSDVWVTKDRLPAALSRGCRLPEAPAEPEKAEKQPAKTPAKKTAKKK